MARLTGENSDVSDFRNLTTTLKRTCPLQTHEALLVSEAYLRNCEIDLTIPDNYAAITTLHGWLTELALPTEAFAGDPPFESKPLVAPEELGIIILFKEAGLHLLSHLQRLQQSSPFSCIPTASLVACLASFTDPQDPWTSDKSHHLSGSLLSIYLSVLHEDSKQFEAIIKDILVHHIKPLFFKARTPLLTPAARQAISPLPGPHGPSDFDATNKPWKFHSPHVVTIFRWVISQLDVPLVEVHWPLIIPPLLAIIDDVSITYKIKGCSLLLLFLNVCPANLLERTGLGEIFHATLVPYLLYLPSLTPEEESIPVLDATYTALIALIKVRYGTSDTESPRTRALDVIFRYGILKGYAHAGENVRIARLLMEKASDLVRAMGLHCVKHLKDFIPVISGILTAPFATAYPPLLEAALQTLRTILVNGWPRIAFHGGEILGGLIICWRRLEDEDKPTSELVVIQRSIEVVLRAAVQLLEGDDRTKRELYMLQAYSSRLKNLLDV
ncbi:MAG: hypothetical protein Q9206_001742 [Seirophora lacunosa]